MSDDRAQRPTDAATSSGSKISRSSVPRPPAGPPRPGGEPLRSTGPGEPILKVLVIAALVVGYLYFVPRVGPEGDPGERVQVLATMAVADHGTFALNKVASGADLARVRVTIPGRRCAGPAGEASCSYSAKAPGTSLLALPVYLALRGVSSLAGAEPEPSTVLHVLRVFVVLLPTLLFLWAFARFLGGTVRGAYERLLVTAVLGLGTLGFTHAHLLAGYQLAAVLTFCAFMLTERAHLRGQRWPLLLAGLCAGWAGITEYSALLLLPGLGAYAVWRAQGRRLWAVGLFVAGVAGPLALALVYHHLCFGSPWTTGPALLAGGSGLAATLGLAAPRPEFLAANFIGPTGGLFFLAPFLLLALPGMIAMWRAGRRPPLALVGFVLVVGLVLGASARPTDGWSLGPRHLTVLAPFLAFAAAQYLEAVRFRSAGYLHLIAIPLALLSIVLTLVSTVTFPAFPEVFRNPIFEWVVPLWELGHTGDSVGSLVGLGAPWSAAVGLVPVAAAAAALAAGPRGHDSESRFLLGALSALVVTAALTGASHLGRAPFPQGEAELAKITDGWASPATARAALARARERARARPKSAAAQARLGRELARAGRSQEAIAVYQRALGALRR